MYEFERQLEGKVYTMQVLVGKIIARSLIRYGQKQITLSVLWYVLFTNVHLCIKK